MVEHPNPGDPGYVAPQDPPAEGVGEALPPVGDPRVDTLEKVLLSMSTSLMAVTESQQQSSDRFSEYIKLVGDNAAAEEKRAAARDSKPGKVRKYDPAPEYKSFRNHRYIDWLRQYDRWKEMNRDCDECSRAGLLIVALDQPTRSLIEARMPQVSDQLAPSRTSTDDAGVTTTTKSGEQKILDYLKEISMPIESAFRFSRVIDFQSLKRSQGAEITPFLNEFEALEIQAMEVTGSYECENSRITRLIAAIDLPHKDMVNLYQEMDRWAGMNNGASMPYENIVSRCRAIGRAGDFDNFKRGKKRPTMQVTGNGPSKNNKSRSRSRGKSAGSGGANTPSKKGGQTPAPQPVEQTPALFGTPNRRSAGGKGVRSPHGKGGRGGKNGGKGWANYSRDYRYYPGKK